MAVSNAVNQLKSHCNNANQQIFGVICDISNSQGRLKLKSYVETNLDGHLDCLINNVGTNKRATIENSTEQEYETMVFSPYQTDATGEARFAKGILDAADAAFSLNAWSQEDNCITFSCQKMRSAQMRDFTSEMDWETLRIGPQSVLNPEERSEMKESMSTGESINEL